MDRVTKLASQRAVVIFSTSSCCMCHTVTRLFRELGVNPTVVELDQDPRGRRWTRHWPGCWAATPRCRRCSSAAGSSAPPTG
ncbi:hypothetical protein BDA96_03G172900 [Sorghum bicolor]|uniref:Glutaredoxin domain-containing protein n=1 Tax=Sorghum bicolor TaxID=4558 RepID=A0A921RC99_SORBI|nr:hypothetical protein BDA96_03G172900 [Sorghum bicolor]